MITKITQHLKFTFSENGNGPATTYGNVEFRRADWIKAAGRRAKFSHVEGDEAVYVGRGSKSSWEIRMIVGDSRLGRAALEDHNKRGVFEIAMGAFPR